jgi:hypothetical protein
MRHPDLKSSGLPGALGLFSYCRLLNQRFSSRWGNLAKTGIFKKPLT